MADATSAPAHAHCSGTGSVACKNDNFGVDNLNLKSDCYHRLLLGQAVWRIADSEIRGAGCAATDFCKLLSLAAASRAVPPFGRTLQRSQSG
jgi:hypothetical protein